MYLKRKSLDFLRHNPVNNFHVLLLNMYPSMSSAAAGTRRDTIPYRKFHSLHGHLNAKVEKACSAPAVNNGIRPNPRVVCLFWTKFMTTLNLSIATRSSSDKIQMCSVREVHYGRGTLSVPLSTACHLALNIATDGMVQVVDAVVKLSSRLIT